MEESDPVVIKPNLSSLQINTGAKAEDNSMDRTVDEDDPQMPMSFQMYSELT